MRNVVSGDTEIKAHQLDGVSVICLNLSFTMISYDLGQVT